MTRVETACPACAPVMRACDACGGRGVVPTEMVPTTINGRWSLLLPKHRAERPEWVTGWERERLNSMHANLRAGDMVWDVGAEEGDLSALFASWVGPGGGVVLIEPNPRVWPNIRAVWAANHLPPPRGFWTGFASDRTTTDPPALTADAASLLAPDPAEPRWPACAVRLPVIGDHGFRHLAQETDVTPQTTLDAFLRRLPPHSVPAALTIDVEGAETEVLLGAEILLTRYRPLVWVSVHEDFMRDLYARTRDDLVALMDGFGYGHVSLATDHEEHVLFHPSGREPLPGDG